MNIIDFDGKIITNRLGLFEICSDADDAEAIFQYLITSNKVLGDAPDIYFFMDAVTYLIFDYELFAKYQIIDDPEYSFKKVLILYLKSEFLVFIKKVFHKRINYDVEEVRITGLFKLKPPHEFERDNRKYSLCTTDSSYIGGTKIPESVYLPILDDYLVDDKLTGGKIPSSHYIYKDIEDKKQSVFMKQSDIDDLIENHYGGYDGSRFKITPPTAYYKDGEKVTQKVITENISFSQSTFEIASEETYQTIIAALTKIINNPGKPLLKDDKAISKHFHKYFPRVTGLSDSLLTKILAKGKPILKERELTKDLTDDYLVRYQSKKLELQDK